MSVVGLRLLLCLLVVSGPADGRASWSFFFFFFQGAHKERKLKGNSTNSETKGEKERQKRSWMSLLRSPSPFLAAVRTQRTGEEGGREKGREKEREEGLPYSLPRSTSSSQPITRERGKQPRLSPCKAPLPSLFRRSGKPFMLEKEKERLERGGPQ